jgi:F-type H+-transporting ATPase subunit b
VLAELKLGPFAIEHPGAFLAITLGFLLLLALIGRFAAPGIRGTFTSRTTHIAEVHEQAERHLTDAQQIRDDYARRIASIEVEHRQRLDAAVRDSDAARADIIADAQEAARALRRRSEEEIARERTKQRILLRQQIVQITLDSAEQSILQLNTEDTQRKLIADFIGRVGVHAGNGRSVAAVGAPDGATGSASATLTSTPRAASLPNQPERGA